MKKIHHFIKKNIVLLIVILLMIILIGLFHEIMTPFVIAVIVVYLIDPMVTNMNRIKLRKRHLPRGLAVICAYIVFLLALTGIGFAFIPSLTSEITRASEELPEYFHTVKDQDLPRWSRRVDDLLSRFSLKNSDDIRKSINQTSVEANKAFDKALDDISDITLPEVDISGQKPLLIAGDRKTRAPKLTAQPPSKNE
ncbi:MAG: AI-2E family transporter, partial [Proteobacteria bacterium]|nr:AI-2E family transporter [Pseudomonadota bacterium]